MYMCVRVCSFVVSMVLCDKVELKKAKNPWQRLAELQLELTEEQKETLEVFRKFQSILNKLTLQNFDKLAHQTLQLKINTEERLKGVIDKIFTKVRADKSMLLLEHTHSSLSHWKKEK